MRDRSDEALRAAEGVWDIAGQLLEEVRAERRATNAEVDEREQCLRTLVRTAHDCVEVLRDKRRAKAARTQSETLEGQLVTALDRLRQSREPF